jgi:hypothetical protein
MMVRTQVRARQFIARVWSKGILEPPANRGDSSAVNEPSLTASCCVLAAACPGILTLVQLP